MDTKEKLQKGDVVILITGWPGVVRKAMKSAKDELVLVDVFGWEHEMGDVYAKDIIHAYDEFAVYPANGRVVKDCLGKTGQSMDALLASVERGHKR